MIMSASRFVNSLKNVKYFLNVFYWRVSVKVKSVVIIPGGLIKASSVEQRRIFKA